MSKSSRFGAALLAVCQLTISSARPAAPQDVTAADPSSLLRELDAAEKQRQSSSSARRNKAYATLATAAAGGSEASHLYEDAVKNTVSEEKQGKGKKTAIRSRSMQMCCAPINCKLPWHFKRGICS